MGEPASHNLKMERTMFWKTKKIGEVHKKVFDFGEFLAFVVGVIFLIILIASFG